MKITTIILFVLLNTLNLSAQQIDSALIKEIPTIKNNVFKQRKEINTLTKKIKQQNKTINDLVEKNKTQEKIIEGLTNLAEVNKSNIVRISKELGTRIQETTDNTKSKLSEINSSLAQKQLYWILAFFITIVLGALMYLFIGKRINLSKTDVESQIKSTKESFGDMETQIKNTKESVGDVQVQIQNTKEILEEENVKLDTKLVEILENQLNLKEQETKTNPVSSNEEIDHSLALKVADEVVRMQKNIAKIGNSTKGIKPLTKGIERIQNNFAANGYEMISLINKKYDERMNIDVINFITDENLSEGSRIITAIIKPQVNFNGVLIQRAQVDVSQN